jgi:hypothetical protein
MMVKSNVCGLEKSLRILSGTVLLLCYYLGVINTGWDIAALIAGSYLLVTGLSEFCPINLLFKINTCRTKIPGTKNKNYGTQEGNKTILLRDE